MINNRIANSRLYNQIISGSLHHTPEQVVKKMGAMQAQDYMQAVWAIGLRSPASKLADVERAIVERKIILTWTLRGTLHFVPAEDVKWMLQLSAPRLASQTKRRMVELGLDDQTLEICREIIVDALKGGKQMDRSVLLSANRRGRYPHWESTRLSYALELRLSRVNLFWTDEW
ncbi:DNA glycosylase AlkZ-like family protein [Paenibacillus sp. B-A-8]|uniref:DNA glycosylase AlkZ-like family protein n=1 Tax=Paenibacillus sp. B-A-8 TaxID=3400419 RepID=UPI003B01AFCE